MSSVVCLAYSTSDVEVGVVVEDAGIDQLVFRLRAAAAGVFVAQVVVGEGALRIFVERLHIGVRGQVVEVEPLLLNVLAVVALWPFSPKRRSLRIESRPFQNAGAKHNR